MTELSPTFGNFSVRGIIVGLLNDKFYTESEKEGGGKWNRLQFGIKLSNDSIIYVELMGIKTTKVKLIYQNPINKKYDKENHKIVNWGEHHKLPKNYKIHMPVKTCLKQSESLEFVSYDAVQYLKENLQDGDSVYINGSLQFHEYKGSIRERFVLKEIGLLDETLDLTDSPEAYFTQEIVFLNSELDEEKNQHKINSYIIGKKDEEVFKVPYAFFINKDKYIYSEELNNIEGVINLFNEQITYGSTLRIFGNINHYVPTVQIDGRRVIAGSVIKKFEITGGSFKSLVKDRYTEEDLNREPEKDPFTYEEESIDFEKSSNEWVF